MSLSSGTPKFRVAIWWVGPRLMNAMQTKFLYSGAGIGGLVLAVTIAKFADRDIQIDLYEAHDAITTTGTGITVSRRTTEVLEALGLYEEISCVLTKPPSSSHGLSRSLSGNRV
jgi:salicylate hydroxylase